MDQDPNSSTKKKVQREYMSNFISMVDQEIYRCRQWLNFIRYPQKISLAQSSLDSNAIAEGLLTSVENVNKISQEMRIIMIGVVIHCFIQIVSFAFGIALEDGSSVAFKISITGVVIWIIILASVIFFWVFPNKWDLESKKAEYVLVIFLVSPLLIVFFMVSSRINLSLQVLSLRSVGIVPVVSGKYNLWSLITRLISDIGIVIVTLPSITTTVEITTSNHILQTAVSIILLIIALTFNELNSKAVSAISKMHRDLLLRTFELITNKMASLYFLANMPQYLLEVDQTIVQKQQQLPKKRVIKLPVRNREFAKLEPLEVVFGDSVLLKNTEQTKSSDTISIQVWRP